MLSNVRQQVVLACELPRAEGAEVVLHGTMHGLDMAQEVLLARKLLGADGTAKGAGAGVLLQVQHQPIVMPKHDSTVAAAEGARLDRDVVDDSLVLRELGVAVAREGAQVAVEGHGENLESSVLCITIAGLACHSSSLWLYIETVLVAVGLVFIFFFFVMCREKEKGMIRNFLTMCREKEKKNDEK